MWTRRLTKFSGFDDHVLDTERLLRAAETERAFDEHGRLGIAGVTNRLNIGEKVRLIPGHCDPTATPTLTSPASGGG